MAVRQAEIGLVHLSVLDFLIENAQAFRVFGGDDNAAGVAVDAVGKGGRKGIFLFRFVFALFKQIPFDPRDERIGVFAVVRVAQQPDFFVEQQNIFVFIQNIQLFRRAHKVIFFFDRFKKFVVDIHLDHVAGLQPGRDFAAPAVDLDALGADIFIQHTLRQAGHGLGHKFVQPLPGVVAVDRKAFHFVFTLRTFD